MNTPGIQLLQRVYETKGIEEAKKLITGNVTVTEKLDAHRFSFQISENKDILFFKKNDNRPLTKVDRVISDLYEKAIYHIEHIPKHIIRSLPENMRFGFSYFPSDKPLRVSYNFKPRGSLVLTDITSRNGSGKVRKVHDDRKFLDNWADVFEVSRPPILYEGPLSESQTSMIMSVISGNETIQAFFTEHIESIFGKTYTNNRIIEGIVIRGDNGLTQIRDPAYKIFDRASEQRVSRDFYDLTLLQINNFMESYVFPASINTDDWDDRYLYVISDAFNSFIEQGLIDESLDPEFLKPKIIGSHGLLGRKFIKNSTTLALTQTPLNEELYKVFLSAFRRERRAHGLLTEQSVGIFNNTVRKIHKYATASSNTREFPMFGSLYESEDKTELGDTEHTPDNIKVIASIQRAFTHKPITYTAVDNDTKKVHILVGDFNPLTHSHLNHALEIAKEETVKVMLCHISRERTGYSGTTFQCSDSIVKNMMASVARDHSETIIGHIVLPYHSLSRLFDVCRKNGCEPMQITVPEGVGANYMTQLYTEEQVLGNRIGIIDSFSITEAPNKNKNAVRRAVEDGDMVTFKKLTPPGVYGFWDNIQNEYMNWSNRDNIK